MFAITSFRFDFIPALKISEISAGAELFAGDEIEKNPDVSDEVRMLYARCHVTEDTLYYKFWEQRIAFQMASCDDYLDDRTNIKHAFRRKTLEETFV